MSFDHIAESPELTDTRDYPSRSGREFGHFKPDFVYRYLKVPHVSVSKLVEVAVALAASHRAAIS